ncbi:hypothetical protein LBMAG52_37930 [Planctomycetia bacterium]|nr:hypothetical protein LBMAG52_37930 [Planctomycetia bacterium]
MSAFDSSLQENAIVTIDAMGTQTAIAAKIGDGGDDDLLPVKGNQGGLEPAVMEARRIAAVQVQPT